MLSPRASPCQALSELPTQLPTASAPLRFSHTTKRHNSSGPYNPIDSRKMSSRPRSQAPVTGSKHPYKITKKTSLPDKASRGSSPSRPCRAAGQKWQLRLATIFESAEDGGVESETLAAANAAVLLPPAQCRSGLRQARHEAPSVVGQRHTTGSGEKKTDADRRDSGGRGRISDDCEVPEEIPAAEGLGALMGEMSLGQGQKPEYRDEAAREETGSSTVVDGLSWCSC